MIRRYKFLQKPLEESTLPGILQYINRFEESGRDKLATLTALMIQLNLAGAGVLTTLQKDHLVKDGESGKVLKSTEIKRRLTSWILSF